MEELLRQQFEAQFGSEWSQPVMVRKENEANERQQERESESELAAAESSESESDSGSDSEPRVVRYNEVATQSNRKHRRQFMSSTAPKEAQAPTVIKTKEDEDNVRDDLELQRLIAESHILDKHKGHSGADISYGDPMEHIGKQRLAVMQQRLEQSGGKQLKQNHSMKITKGMKAKAKERYTARKAEAKEAGIVLAKEKKVRKHRVHDKGLKINSVGKATAHGINVSARDIARINRRKR